MKEDITNIQIRFSDIDWMGHVNNATYLTYFEIARLEYFQRSGLVIDWKNIGFILARTEINYLKPVLLNDKLEIKTYCSHIGSKSFSLSHSLLINNETIYEAANAQTVLVCYNYATSQSETIPDPWIHFLKKELK